MKNQQQAEIITLQKQLRKLENDCSTIREKLKIYGYKDSSENADWVVLNEKLSIYQSQIDSLKAKIVEMNWKHDKIITYRILETGQEITVRLTSGEPNPHQDKISRVSPMGTALDQKKVGEISEVKTPQKSYKIKIINIQE